MRGPPGPAALVFDTWGEDVQAMSNRIRRASVSRHHSQAQRGQEVEQRAKTFTEVPRCKGRELATQTRSMARGKELKGIAEGKRERKKPQKEGRGLPELGWLAGS